MECECMITTIDNPYDYFEQFDSWFQFDTLKGYNTCSRLARFVNITDDMTEQEEQKEVERACDEVISLDFLDIYKKVKRQTTKKDQLGE